MQKKIYSKDHFQIITEDEAEEGPTIWIRDDLDEAHLSFTRHELRSLLPILVDWAREEGEVANG